MARSLYARLARRFGSSGESMTRREALRVGLAGAAGVLLSDYLPAWGAGSEGKRVLIIGAGFSGLACGHELRSAGYDVTVLEARSRPGGRVISFKDLVEGKHVEGGGELIGSNHPTWIAYAEKFGLTFTDVSDDDEIILLNGQVLSEKQAEALYEEMGAALKRMNQDAQAADADQPWKTPGAVDLDRRHVQAWIDALNASDLCKSALRVQFTADNGVPAARQSYLGHLAQVKGGGLESYWTDSEVYRCKGGNQQLASRLAQAIGQERVHLKAPATEIQVREQGVSVRTADGRAFEADDVVLTVPPSVWDKIRFLPVLPDDLATQMGMNVKYLSVVKKRFWKEKGLPQYSLTDGLVQMTWECTDGQEEPGPVVLNAFAGGAEATAATEMSSEERDARFKKELESLYPGFGENFMSARFMGWPKDPWVRGSYSFPAPGQITSVGPRLHQGLHDRLHFAGEYVCYKFVGYMEGALNSGVATARRLAVRDGAAAPTP